MIYISTDALSLIFPALENLRRSNEVPTMNDPNDKRNVPGYYGYWFRSLESALLCRGKMGSLAGASEVVRKGSGHDSSLQEYAVRILYLPFGLMLNAYLVNQCFRDRSYRGHDRGHGHKVVPPLANGLCWSSAHRRFMSRDRNRAQLGQLQAILEDDELRLRERYDQEILRDLRSAEDIWNTIRPIPENTDAKEYFLSMMRHLLLIQEESHDMVGYYRLMDCW
jgi:cytokinesis protein